MDNERYLYEVRPRKPVRIPGQRATMTRRSLQLTKEEVKEYMKSGPVYRKSVKGELIQVTGGTLEKLHAPFGNWKTDMQAPKAPAPTTSGQPESYTQQPYQNSSQQGNNFDKKNKKHRDNNRNNYHGDDRGKAVTNGSAANPQYSGNNDQGQEQTSTAGAPIVNLP